MIAKLTVHLYGRTEVTTHADRREARARMIDIATASKTFVKGWGSDEGTLNALSRDRLTVGDPIGSWTLVDVEDDAHLYWVIETAAREVPFTGTEAEVRAQAREFYVGGTIRRVTAEELEEVKQGR
ncbi:hypothetical protein I5G58_gp101 [Mycobacterium phage BirdsNest]|uniref:Uncharacterized protein n=1 Tax=Mycobacterium phage BirdsNest TaxID=2686231 RepID=A0A6B9L9F6_9CAUD|nr:hypothetical protein I5G58_gp101 [Mycobacterium phage BirdsNest]QHB37403.1 hypothetical protein PBI_BIRDSNEST_101 [Mycobacterium phage BirdsNest]